MASTLVSSDKAGILTIDKKEAVEFLLKEYEMFHELRRDLIQLQEARLNVYLTAVGGSIAALGVSTQIKQEILDTFPHLIPFIGSMLAICLFIFGLITFFRLIERGIEIVIVSRAINRIRCYFSESEVKSYILFPICDKEPEFASIGLLKGGYALMIGLPQIVALFNGLIVALASSIFIRWISMQPTEVIWGVGFFFFVLTIGLHNIYYHKRIKQIDGNFNAVLEKWKIKTNEIAGELLS